MNILAIGSKHVKNEIKEFIEANALTNATILCLEENQFKYESTYVQSVFNKIESTDLTIFFVERGKQLDIRTSMFCEFAKWL